MPESNPNVWQDFEARYPAEARGEIVKRLLEGALTEVICSECGRYAMTVERAQTSAGFECPGCHKRTYAVLEAGHYAVISETRLARLMAHARAKPWFCPDHPGTAVAIARMETNERDPRRVTLHYVCRRGRRFFGRRRVHSGTLALNLLALEVEMLAATGSSRSTR